MTAEITYTSTNYERLVPVSGGSGIQTRESRWPIQWQTKSDIVRNLVVTTLILGGCVGAYEFSDILLSDHAKGEDIVVACIASLCIVFALFSVLLLITPPYGIALLKYGIRLWVLMAVATCILGPMHGKMCADYKAINATPRVSDVAPSFALPGIVRFGLITLRPQFINTFIYGISSMSKDDSCVVCVISNNTALLYGEHDQVLNPPVQADGMVWLEVAPPALDLGYTAATLDLQKRFPNFTIASSPVIVTSTNLLQSITSSKHVCKRVAVAFWSILGVVSVLLFIMSVIERK